MSGIAAADYKGANSLSVAYIIQRLPERIVASYHAFYQYFSSTTIRHNTYQSSIVFGLLFCITSIIIITTGIVRLHTLGTIHVVLRTVIVLSLFFLFPVASNISLLLSPDGGRMVIQMTMPMTILSSLLIGLAYDVIHTDSLTKTKQKLLRTAIIGTAVFLITGNTLQCSVDQQVMLTSRQATLGLMNRIVADLEAKGTLSTDPSVIFIGTPSESTEFRKDELWDYSNSYAHYGQFTLYSNNCIFSYRGLMRDGGWNIDINADHEYWKELTKTEAIKQMPAYPSNGYAAEDALGNIIIKLAHYNESTYSFGW